MKARNLLWIDRDTRERETAGKLYDTGHKRWLKNNHFHKTVKLQEFTDTQSEIVSPRHYTYRELDCFCI